MKNTISWISWNGVFALKKIFNGFSFFQRRSIGEAGSPRGSGGRGMVFPLLPEPVFPSGVQVRAGLVLEENDPGSFFWNT